ncbi:adenosylcobinamide-phosphate synthase CbiB [Pseudomaricurvus sp. HS19]|uniref:adenosylcobinamide-phosphate synthase CbiB n=1 Tax=Pseudomaricurvus sp. HS19 TaxID=2692626 RepID=UPI0013712B85|nr:adenosylcobinamide-phosphate synthase CbiB [Pseudomaricurvus sp. HS19]MYM63161.1 cobalamin biosynthesis protein [Pseudomaricurvus sp. HS19]
MNAVLLMLGLLLDRLLGEPRRWHPLVGFGHLAAAVEKRLNRDTQPQRQRLLAGVAGWCLLVLPLPLLLWQLPGEHSFYWPLAVLSLWFSVGWRSLREHAIAVADAHRWGGLDAARQAVSRIVSRDTEPMDEPAVSRATIESVLENGSDAIFAPIFWFVLLGPAGAVGYRFANTLDAMWGYRTDRYEWFGKCAARMDDLLNWVPARLTAATYAAAGNWRTALSCWRQQSAACASPNGGVVMCAGAGALQVALGGGAWYHGQWQARPVMGCGDTATLPDVQSAVALVDRSVWIWVAVLVFVQLFF